jgi:EAL domain-containing protein (putative c-di-GMP-specific phosphodiesterase class I)
MTGEVSAADFSFAFQPIVDTQTMTVYSHEALVRGLNNEPADTVLKRYSPTAMPALDAACRAKAIEVAARIGIHTHLNLNFLPSTVFNAALGLDSTIAAAQRHAFPLDRIIVEATEGEAIGDYASFGRAVNEYRRAGIRFAIDDFGAGYSGLNMLAEFQPDMIKLDISLVRCIQSHGPRQAIVRAISQVCVDLGIDFIVEGVETIDEFAWFSDLGVYLFQGFLFARPQFEAMPPFDIPRPASVL